jgi:flagellar biosynthesis protein FlhF
MRLKLYRGASMAEAMASVRRELGAEALILSTRRVGDGVEITAALEPDAGPPPPLVTARLAVPGEEREPEVLSAHPSPQRGAPATALPPWVRAAAPIHGDARPRDDARAAALAFHGVPETLARRLLAGPLPFALAAAFRFAAAPLAPDAPPMLFAGPPGAGKTLTVARLASRLVMGGTAPLVITADGKRAGATEQLAAFTRLLGIDLIVACTPAMIARALTRRVDGAPVLIDGPGTDAFDPGQQDEIRGLAASASATVSLVLPAGLDPVEAGEIAAAHRHNGATLLIANRLDGARRLGGILAAAASGLALIEAGTGPGAADGLVPLTADFLAARLMQLPDRTP